MVMEMSFEVRSGRLQVPMPWTGRLSAIPSSCRCVCGGRTGPVNKMVIFKAILEAPVSSTVVMSSVHKIEVVLISKGAASESVMGG